MRPTDVIDVAAAAAPCGLRPANAPGPAPAAAATEGWVHSTETCGAVDGPGIRYVLFLSGCPLRCAYCHNPDTWHRHEGTLTSVAELLTDIGRYRGFIQAHGGVTLSGGEPLAQPRFVKALLRGCKAMGLHTALDTSGYLGALVDDEMMADLDLVLLDIKAFSEKRYRRLTGAELEPTLEFARRLAAIGKPIVLRYVLVPGWTDHEAEIRALAAFAAGLGNVQRVDVLPFHQMGEHKWRERDLNYRLAGVAPPSDEAAERTRSLFRAAGLQVS
ncbi:pyruvate formate-lyase 1-activating enzyme [Rubrivivax gelatinosus]|uniref:pyruvate formate-lyase-activating protein n=1 Tax=Rubrivivax gelatinosus TaxID=28068 RepID=UPI0019055D26|nr:pyruvate formate-lyase-activating protein [Rubrivivax gelatinosus]MBK1613100.1 pyruvate formate-lyase 1-activating enzyme [Rubrivivax gelatinosus]